MTLSLVAISTRVTLWPKLRRTSKANHDSVKSSYIFTPIGLTPLYVHRITQARIRKAERRLTEVCANISFAQNNDSNIESQFKSDLWKKKRERSEKRKERLAKGPRIDPEKLKRINHEWRLIYGFENPDLFHVENELDNIVSKLPYVHGKKSKTIRFDDSVHVEYIEKKNTGRRMSKWKSPIDASKSPIPKFTSGGDVTV